MVNPAAGRKGEIEEKTRAVLESRGIPHVVNVSRSGPDVRNVIDKGIREGYRHFVAVGGDGTANLVADALLANAWAEPPILAILPAGSGSDFIRTFGFSRNFDEAADRLLTDMTYRIDVGVLSGSWGRRHFLNAANVGLTAATARTASRLPRWVGGLRYHIAFWVALPRSPVTPVTVDMGDRRFEGPALAVLVANGQFAGGGMNLAPRASLTDGELDVQIFAVRRKRKAFVLMPRAVRGVHLGHPGVKRYSAGTIEIGTSADWLVECDGEMVGNTPVSVRVLSGAIDFKV
jgi:YegS/Rv2252/BmrU family lipid kinase